MEADAEALVSPTHLVLGVAAGLVALGPIRAAVRRAAASSWSAKLPAVLGIAAIAGLVGFATHLVHPLVDPWPLFPVGRAPDQYWSIPNLGIARRRRAVGTVWPARLVTLHRVWPSPRPGAIALLVILAVAPLTILHDRGELAVTVVVAAAALDVVSGAIRRRLGDDRGLVAIAALGPFVLFGLELVQLGGAIRWSAHLLGGFLVVAAVTGALVGLVATLRQTPDRATG